MISDEDEILFADDEPEADGLPAALGPWKVLIVDDEEQVHAVTRMVLADFRFRERGLTFLSARSAAEGRALLEQHPDIAVVFLDVVMESEHAGLDLAREIRGPLENQFVRIVLRTGQPGQAPEQRVIVDYDINDYKEKSELTANKLFVTMVTALRSYADIITIEKSRRALENIISASARLFQAPSMKQFLSGLLAQIEVLFEIGLDAVLVSARSEEGDPNLSLVDLQAIDRRVDLLRVVAATGRFVPLTDHSAADLEPVVLMNITNAIASRESIYFHDYSVVYFQTRHRRVTVLYLETNRPLSDHDHHLIRLFCNNASAGLDMFS